MNFYKNFLVLLSCAVLFVGSGQAQGMHTHPGAPVTVDSRIKTFVYSANEVFTVVFNYGYHSYIEFAKGETVKVMALGNNANWKIKPVDNKLYIMPLEKEGHTNMLLETSKGRSYAFDLVSKSLPMDDTYAVGVSEHLGREDSALSDLAYVVRFYYPQSEREFDMRGQKIEITAPSFAHDPELEDIDIRPNATRANYVFTAGSADVAMAPMHAFDDGALTYIKFSDSNMVIPKVYLLDRDGGKIPCRMLLLKGYVIIEGVHELLYLDFGDRGVTVTNQSLG
ncbi:P-type conjugative transfer protein VirB9 [Candidatus Anaplasma sp. TIGMIC]|nr:P-type conjugative transfer protein VirB9 [Candidatus Anaplasma sp. TIGMIC]MDB1135275.1 P-type conjugative transfer protein VirB9 [Candidatus Anaplasma sp. TIGMIC]